MKRYATELIGTYFLVFTIGMVAVAGTEAAPIAIGAVLTVMVYMGGHVSGAHYNPAVTIALYLRGVLPRQDVVPYIGAQILAGWAAAASVHMMNGSTFAPAPGPAYGALAALFAEVLLTFALVLVILHVATSESTRGNQYYGLAIGLTVLGGAYVVGPVSGAAFNPAVGLGPTVVETLAGDGTLSDLWIYLFGPVAGGTLAIPVFRLQEGGAPPAD